MSDFDQKETKRFEGVTVSCWESNKRIARWKKSEWKIEGFFSRVTKGALFRNIEAETILWARKGFFATVALFISIKAKR